MDCKIDLLVTSIVEITNKRRLVYINYEPAFALYNTEIRKYDIKQDSSIDYEVYKDIVENVLNKRATVRAMSLLKNKDYTEKELRDKLKDGYYPEESVNTALDYVKSFKYVDDYRYAYNYISFKSGVKSRKYIELKLKEKGIASKIISSVCEEYYSDNSNVELEQVLEFLSNKCSIDADSDYKEKQKVMAKLYRKGYSVDIINKALDIVVNDAY